MYRFSLLAEIKRTLRYGWTSLRGRTRPTPAGPGGGLVGGTWASRTATRRAGSAPANAIARSATRTWTAAIPVAPSVAPYSPPPCPPRRLMLRRSAVFALFEAADLGPPPSLLWRFVDGDDDIGQGVARFLATVGATADSTPLTALLRAESGLREVNPAQARAWEAAMLSGDTVAMRAAVIAAAAASGPRLDLHWPIGAVSYSAAIDMIEEELQLHARLREALALGWPETWVGTAEGDQLRQTLVRFENAELAAFTAVSLGRNAILPLAEVRDANIATAALLAGASGVAITTASPPADRDTAAIEAATDWPGALAAWRDVRWRHHRDRPGLSADERRRRDRICTAADRALRRREGSAGRRSP